MASRSPVLGRCYLSRSGTPEASETGFCLARDSSAFSAFPHNRIPVIWTLPLARVPTPPYQAPFLLAAAVVPFLAVPPVGTVFVLSVDPFFSPSHPHSFQKAVFILFLFISSHFSPLLSSLLPPPAFSFFDCLSGYCLLQGFSPFLEPVLMA